MELEKKKRGGGIVETMTAQERSLKVDLYYTKFDN